MKISARTSALFLAAIVAVAAAAACSGNSGGGTPTAVPTPFTPTNCQVVWLTASSSNAATFQTYVVDMPIANWVSGTKSFAPGLGANAGIFYYQLDVQQATAKAVGLATAGSFSVTVGGTGAGQATAVTDSDPQSYYDSAHPVIGAFLATGGTGSFTGQWSDPDPAANPTFGTGTVTVLFQGSSLELGRDASFALCYDANAFAPESAVDRGLRFVNRYSL